MGSAIPGHHSHVYLVSTTLSIAGARETCHLSRFKPMHSSVYIISYLHNVITESKELFEPAHMNRLVNASVILPVSCCKGCALLSLSLFLN